TPAAAAPPGGLAVWWYVFLLRLATLREFWYWQVLGWLLFPLGILYFFKMAAGGDPEGAAYLIGGNVVFGLVISTVQFVSSDLAWARQRNDLDFFATLPVSRLQLVLAFVAVSALSSIPGAIINLQVAGWVLHQPVAWQPVLLLLVTLSVLSMAGVGVMIGVTARNGTHANIINNIVLVGVTFLSPVFVPLERLPEILQYTAMVLPTTYAAHGMRAAALGGDGSGLWVDLAVLAGWAAVSLWLAVTRLEWRRD
ncbi:MAG TPA: ABC transporter permease, partial [Bacillota bacterium]